jgi:hypothetical protein
VATPVTLPPGRLKLATRPSSTGSPAIVKTMGTDARGLGRDRRSGAAEGHDHRRLTEQEIGRQHRQSIELIGGPAEFGRHIPAFDIAGFFQALTKRDQAQLIVQLPGGVAEKPDHRHRRLLRARRERPRRRTAAERG